MSHVLDTAVAALLAELGPVECSNPGGPQKCYCARGTTKPVALVKDGCVTRTFCSPKSAQAHLEMGHELYHFLGRADLPQGGRLYYIPGGRCKNVGVYRVTGVVRHTDENPGVSGQVDELSQPKKRSRTVGTIRRLDGDVDVHALHLNSQREGQSVDSKESGEEEENDENGEGDVSNDESGDDEGEGASRTGRGAKEMDPTLAALLTALGPVECSNPDGPQRCYCARGTTKPVALVKDGRVTQTFCSPRSAQAHFDMGHEIYLQLKDRSDMPTGGRLHYIPGGKCKNVGKYRVSASTTSSSARTGGMRSGAKRRRKASSALSLSPRDHLSEGRPVL